MKDKSNSTGFIMNIRLVSALILAILILSACQPVAAIAPLAQPTAIPTGPPSVAPTTDPTAEPTATPTAAPTEIPTAEPVTAPTFTPTATSPEPALDVATDPKLGQILVGDNGMTLYIFTQDEPDKSNCDAACLEKWPPLLTHGSPNLGPGVDASLVGTAALADGSLIVTYNQMPLYYWFKDANPGDTTGLGVGDVWFVLSPAGVVIRPPPAVPTTKPSKEKEKEGDY